MSGIGTYLSEQHIKLLLFFECSTQNSDSTLINLFLAIPTSILGMAILTLSLSLARIEVLGEVYETNVCYISRYCILNSCVCSMSSCKN